MPYARYCHLRGPDPAIAAPVAKPKAADRPMTAEAFRAWLEAMPPDQVVYQRELGQLTSRLCPIAKYLGSTGDGQIGVCDITLYVGEFEYAMPEWGRAFIDRFDGAKINPATAADCLAILGAT